MPMPTKTYKVVVERFTVQESDFVHDMAEVNDLAGQGYEVEQMLAIGGGAQPGGFVYLMSRTVTTVGAKRKKNG
jgi:hypothetical protein